MKILLTSILLLVAATPAATVATPATRPFDAAVPGVVVRQAQEEHAAEAPQEHGAEVPAEHAPEAEHATDGEHAAGGEHGSEVGHEEEWGTEVMMHHITDAHEIELPLLGTIELPRWAPITIGPLVVDMSPTKHTFWLFVATLLTILTVSLAGRHASREGQAERAPKGFLNFFETFYEYLRDEVAMANIGHGGERFVPYVVTLFFFILYSNLLGLLPFGATATSNIMVTAALAIVSLVIVEAAGFAALGPKGYMGTIFYVPKGLPAWMVPIMLVIMTPVEIIGKLAKPFALAVRLFANMTAGHFVILALLGLILTYGGLHAIGAASVVGSLALGVFVMFLEIFVAFLQAYIFTILTAVFIGLIRHAH